MGEFRKYIWAFPLIGALICLIAFFTPAAIKVENGDSYYIWIWSFVYYRHLYGLITGVVFMETPSIIFSILIILSVIFLIVSSLKYRKNTSNRKKFQIMGIVTSLGILGLTIGWMIEIEIWMYSLRNPSFWNVYSPGFGVIGMFIGGIFSLVSIIYTRITEKRDDPQTV